MAAAYMNRDGIADNYAAKADELHYFEATLAICAGMTLIGLVCFVLLYQSRHQRYRDILHIHVLPCHSHCRPPPSPSPLTLSILSPKVPRGMEDHRRTGLYPA